MMQENLEILNLILGSGGILGIGFLVFRTGKIVKTVENLEKKVDKLEQKTEEGFKEVDRKFEKFEEKIDKKFEKFEEKINDKFEKFEEKVDERFKEFDKKMDERFKESDRKSDERFKKLEDNLPLINISIAKIEFKLDPRTYSSPFPVPPITTIEVPKNENNQLNHQK